MTDPQNPDVPPPAVRVQLAAAAGIRRGARPTRRRRRRRTARPPTRPFPGRTLGIVALIVAIFFNVIGLILGIVALVQSRKAGHKNGFAVAAIIVGAVLTVLGIIVAILVFTAFAAAAGFAGEVLQACQAVDFTGTVTVQGSKRGLQHHRR